MFNPYLRRSLSAAAAGLAVLATPALAVDFESIAPNLFFSGESFAEDGFTLTVNGDFGVVDTAAAFVIAVAPSGNATQFYGGLNDSQVALTSSDGGVFRLSGFDAAFIAPVPQDPGVIAGRIELSAIDELGNSLFGSWELAASGIDGSFAFMTFASPADFADFGSLRSATFNACVYDGNDCLYPFENLAQFALDNINVVVVPEPSTYALVILGLAALSSRRWFAPRRQSI